MRRISREALAPRFHVNTFACQINIVDYKTKLSHLTFKCKNIFFLKCTHSHKKSTVQLVFRRDVTSLDTSAVWPWVQQHDTVRTCGNAARQRERILFIKQRFGWIGTAASKCSGNLKVTRQAAQTRALLSATAAPLPVQAHVIRKGRSAEKVMGNRQEVCAGLIRQVWASVSEKNLERQSNYWLQLRQKVGIFFFFFFKGNLFHPAEHTQTEN